MKNKTIKLLLNTKAINLALINYYRDKNFLYVLSLEKLNKIHLNYINSIYFNKDFYNSITVGNNENVLTSTIEKVLANALESYYE
jgi:hypothetical protein